MKEIEKKEYETNKIVWMLVWRELVWQIPFSLLVLPILFSSVVLPEILAYVLMLLAVILILVFTTKLAFNGTIKKAIIRKDQVNGIAVGYLWTFIITGIQNLENPNALAIVSLLIQLAIAYLYIKKLLNNVAI